MRTSLLFLALVTLFSSCKNLVPYTSAMKNKYKWSEENIKKIQFYVSNDVILQRKLTNATTEIVQGKIKTIKGSKVDQITILAGTKGVVTSMPKDNKLMLSFEIGDDHNLSFGVNPNASDKFVLLASDWNDGMGRIHYAGNEYYSSPDSKYASLLVDLRKIENSEVKQHVAKGRKVQ